MTLLILLFFFANDAYSAELRLPASLAADDMNILAAQLSDFEPANEDDNGAFVLNLMNGRYPQAKISLEKILATKQDATGWQDSLFFAYQIYLDALMDTDKDFERAFAESFKRAYAQLDLKRAHQLSGAYNYSLSRGDSWVSDLFG